MLIQNWENAYYYDEAQELTYINQDRLNEKDMVALIQIVGFVLEQDDETGDYTLWEVRHQEGDLFDESFETIQEAFNRLNAYFDDTLYEWVTNKTYPVIWAEHQAALA